MAARVFGRVVALDGLPCEVDAEGVLYGRPHGGRWLVRGERRYDKGSDLVRQLATFHVRPPSDSLYIYMRGSRSSNGGQLAALGDPLGSAARYTSKERAMTTQHTQIRLNDQDAVVDLHSDSEMKTLRIGTTQQGMTTTVTIDGPTFFALRAAIQHATGEN